LNKKPFSKGKRNKVFSIKRRFDHGFNTNPLVSPRLAMAVGEQNSTWTDYGMSWNNSGKNGHYAPINWSNA